MKRSSLALVAVTLLAAIGMSLHSQVQTQNQPPSPSRSRSDEMLDRWNDIGNKLIAMAKDFPEDKYDFKVPSQIIGNQWFSVEKALRAGLPATGKLESSR